MIIATALCRWHSCTNDSATTDGFCSKKCKSKYYVDKKRRNLKKEAVEYKGGKCTRCGYSKSVWALSFHHVNPEEKDFAISKKGTTKSFDRIRKEIDKCILVCLNCHAELHEEMHNRK